MKVSDPRTATYFDDVKTRVRNWAKLLADYSKFASSKFGLEECFDVVCPIAVNCLTRLGIRSGIEYAVFLDEENSVQVRWTVVCVNSFWYDVTSAKDGFENLTDMIYEERITPCTRAMINNFDKKCEELGSGKVAAFQTAMDEFVDLLLNARKEYEAKSRKRHKHTPSYVTRGKK